MPCVPTASVLVVHDAVRALPLPASATAAQPAIVAPLAVNATLPLGEAPFTVAVYCRLAPAFAGLAELASVVVVAVTAAPGPTTCTDTPDGEADSTLKVMPYWLSTSVRPASSAASVNVDVAGVVSRSCVSLLELLHPPQSVANGDATRMSAPLLG